MDVEKDAPAEDLAALVARIAAEAAATLDWVQQVELTLKSAHGETRITCAWDAIVAYAKKESTMAEFHATWTCERASRVAPRTAPRRRRSSACATRRPPVPGAKGHGTRHDKAYASRTRAAHRHSRGASPRSRIDMEAIETDVHG